MDVVLFHQHFGLPAPGVPQLLAQDVLEFRVKFMGEELEEFKAGAGVGDLAGMADALIDLVYVVMGTAVMMGLPWQLLWQEVQAKNMQKVKVQSADDSKRGHRLDIKKPEGWTPPDIAGLLERYRASVTLPGEVFPPIRPMDISPKNEPPLVACRNCGGDGFSIEGGPCPACYGEGKVRAAYLPPLKEPTTDEARVQGYTQDEDPR